MKVIIIEDEWLVAEDLSASLIQVRPDAEIVRILGSVKEAVDYFIDKPEVDLIFSDIQLGDGLSFEISAQVEINAPVIFCTAFDEYAIEAFKTNGIDYILKPFTIHALEGALTKYEKLKKEFTGKIAHQYEVALKILSSYKLDKNSATYIVRYRDQFLPIGMDKIALFYLENEVGHLLTHLRKLYTVTETLEELERKCGHGFFRINRQFLVNRNAIRDVVEHFPRKLKVNLTFAFEGDILVSKERRGKFLEWLRQEIN